MNWTTNWNWKWRKWRWWFQSPPRGEDLAVKLQILRANQREQVQVERLRNEILAAIIECNSYESLYERCMEILDETAPNITRFLDT